MKCIHCDGDTRVLRTRKGATRRRECVRGHRFTTDELARLNGREALITRRRIVALQDQLRIVLKGLL